VTGCLQKTQYATLNATDPTYMRVLSVPYLHRRDGAQGDGVAVRDDLEADHGLEPGR
jgi:hypothetical protein